MKIAMLRIFFLALSPWILLFSPSAVDARFVDNHRHREVRGRESKIDNKRLALPLSAQGNANLNQLPVADRHRDLIFSFPCFGCGFFGPYASPEITFSDGDHGGGSRWKGAEPSCEEIEPPKTACGDCHDECGRSTKGCSCYTCECKVCDRFLYGSCCSVRWDAGCSRLANKICSNCDCEDYDICPGPAPTASPRPSYEQVDSVNNGNLAPTKFRSQSACPVAAPSHLPLQCQYSEEDLATFAIGSCPATVTRFQTLNESDEYFPIGRLEGLEYGDRTHAVRLKFDFNWMGLYRIPKGNTLLVSRNGQIFLSPTDAEVSQSDSARPIDGSFGGPRIGLCHSSLNPDADEGSSSSVVLTKSTETSLVISFQNIPWTDLYDDGIVANVQAELFPDGRITICFGDGDNGGIPFSTGVEDSCLGLLFPAADYGFDSNGISYAWPAGYCYCFDPCPNLDPSDPPPPPFECPLKRKSKTKSSHECPSQLPSSSSTMPPTVLPTVHSCASKGCPSTYFRPVPNTKKTFSDRQVLSLDDDDTHIMELPFDLNWMGREMIAEGSNISISANGQIHVSAFDESGYNTQPVDGSFKGPRIALAQSDLDPSAGGEIVLLTKEMSFLVSYQGIPFHTEGGFINVQAEVFSDGKVTICFGSGGTTSPSFATGVEDPCLGLFFPATDESFGFDSSGVSCPGIWPENYCYCFDPCQEKAYAMPPLTCSDGCGSCLVEHESVGCSCLECERLVCLEDDDCCDSGWDSACTGYAENLCSCEGEPTASPIPTFLPTSSPVPSSTPTCSISSKGRIRSNHECTPDVLTPAPSIPPCNPEGCSSAGFHFLTAEGPKGSGVSKLQFYTNQDSESSFIHFDLDWMGVQPIPTGSEISISPRGQIQFLSPDDVQGRRTRRVDGSFGAARIALAQGGLEPADGGVVLISRQSNDSLVVSFQGVPFSDAFAERGFVNVQTEIFKTGKVSICFGPGNSTLQHFATGVEDPCLGLIFPATDESRGFDAYGVSCSDIWPEGYCYCYDPCISQASTPSPTSQKAAGKAPGSATTDPTMSPSYSPSIASKTTPMPTTLYPTFNPTPMPQARKKKNKAKKIKSAKTLRSKSEKIKSAKTLRIRGR